MVNTKIILISNQLIFREALARFLEEISDIGLTVETSSYPEALKLIKESSPNLCLVDVELSRAVVERTAKAIVNTCPQVRLLFLSSIANKKQLVQFISFNAKGYLTTDLPPEVFNALLKDAIEGRCAISPSILEEVLAQLRGGFSKDKKADERKELTCREKEVLHQLVSGATNREIAHSLVISESTVKNHIHNMLEKLRIQNRTQLISYALTNGLLADL